VVPAELSRKAFIPFEGSGPGLPTNRSFLSFGALRKLCELCERRKRLFYKLMDCRDRFNEPGALDIR
jgi:hypothetical protein